MEAANNGIKTYKPVIRLSKDWVRKNIAISYAMALRKRGINLEVSDAMRLVADIFAEALISESWKNNVLVMGDVGTGKTTFIEAARMLCEYCYERHRGSMLSVFNALSISRMSVQGMEDSGIFTAHAICIDDMGTEPEVVNHYGTKINHVADIILERYARCKSTYITTNLNLIQIKDRYGERVFDRLCESYHMGKLKGKSYRLGEVTQLSKLV